MECTRRTRRLDAPEIRGVHPESRIVLLTVLFEYTLLVVAPSDPPCLLCRPTWRVARENDVVLLRGSAR